MTDIVFAHDRTVAKIVGDALHAYILERQVNKLDHAEPPGSDVRLGTR